MLAHHPTDPFGLPVAPRPHSEIKPGRGQFVRLGRRETPCRFKLAAEFDGHESFLQKNFLLASKSLIFQSQRYGATEYRDLERIRAAIWRPLHLAEVESPRCGSTSSQKALFRRRRMHEVCRSAPKRAFQPDVE